MEQGIVLTGQKELIKKLANMEKKAARKAMNKAMGKAVRPVIRAAKSNVRPISTTVAKSVGVKRKRYQSGATQIAIVGARVADNLKSTKTVRNPFTGAVTEREHWPWNTAHLIEDGTAPHQIHIPWLKMTIQHPGTEAHPWLEPAFKNNEEKVIRIHTQILREEIETYARAKA